MNRYDAQLDAALRELQSWRSRLPAGDATSAQTYDFIAEALRDAKQQCDPDATYEALASLNRFICDQAPLSAEFVPSFKSLFLQLHDERHQRI